jgi:hypothetical protein
MIQSLEPGARPLEITMPCPIGWALFVQWVPVLGLLTWNHFALGWFKRLGKSA